MDAEPVTSPRKRQELTILTSYSESVFLLASQISIGKKPVELLPAPVGKGYVLQCEWPYFQLPFEEVLTPVAELLQSCGASRVGKFWSEPSPVLDMDFDSQASIEQMIDLLESGQVRKGMELIILSLGQTAWSQTNPDSIPKWKLDISLELLQVLPNADTKDAIIHQVTSTNSSMCAHLWNERKVFDIGALLRWYRSNPLGGTMGVSGDIRLLDLVQELKEVVGWSLLGLQLGVPKHTLETIRCQYAMYGEEMCKTEMLSTWLDGHTEEPTWAEVVSAMSRTGNMRVARKIANKYGLALAVLTEANTSTETSSVAMETIESLRRDMEGTLRVVEDNESQMQLCTRKKRKLEGDLAETRDNCDIVRKYTEMLTKDKESLQQRLEEKEREIRSLQSKQLEYERTIRDLEVKLATAGAKAKQKLKDKLKLMKQEKEELVECIEAKQNEVSKVTKKLSKLTLKLERAKKEQSFAQSQLELKTTQLDEVQQQLQLVRDQRDELKKQLEMQEKAMEEAAMRHVESDEVASKPPEHPIEEEWFFGDIDQELAESKCVTNGDYLVRYSSHLRRCVLTCNVKGRGSHFVIQQITDVMNEMKFCFESTAFRSIQELLDHYTKCKLPITRTSGALLVKPVCKWSVRHDEIQWGRRIGRGYANAVFEGVLLTTQEKVAIKTRQIDTQMQDMGTFLRDTEILKQYNHPNIVRLIGVCTENESIYIIMELMPGGSFLTFLRGNGPHQPKKKLCEMCIDVCSGMAYLEANNCVHCDLAARNCLVGCNDVVKISNFAMSRVEKKGIQTVSSETKRILIKWTAPEVLNYDRYTSSSDVWSFGVLLWEVFSCGSRPYPCMTNRETRTQVELGYRMPPPAETPEDIYGIMQQCWQCDAEKRPNFVTLISMLQQARQNITT